jgi:DNA-binding CsgD family transcriptional regulator
VRRGRPAYPDVLTPREWEVLSLIKEGLTNPQIAQRLGISEHGARFHVSEILSKLGVESRQEAAQWTPRQPIGRRHGLFGGLSLRIVGSLLAKAAAGIAVAAGVAMLGALLLGTVAMNGREEQVPEASATPSELLVSSEEQTKQALPPPYENLRSPVPRPDERLALSVDAAKQELSKNADLARVIAAAESGDVTALLNLGRRADDEYCRSFRALPPECITQEDKVSAVYLDIGTKRITRFGEMREWLGELYADNPAKLTFACRDSRLAEGDGGKYYLLFTASRAARAGGLEVGGLALVVTPGSPQPIEIFTFTNPGALGLQWVQLSADPQFLVLITPESVKDWPGKWGELGQ